MEDEFKALSKTFGMLTVLYLYIYNASLECTSNCMSIGNTFIRPDKVIPYPPSFGRGLFSIIPSC